MNERKTLSMVDGSVSSGDFTKLKMSHVNHFFCVGLECEKLDEYEYQLGPKFAKKEYEITIPSMSEYYEFTALCNHCQKDISLLYRPNDILQRLKRRNTIIQWFISFMFFGLWTAEFIIILLVIMSDFPTYLMIVPFLAYFIIMFSFGYDLNKQSVVSVIEKDDSPFHSINFIELT